MNEVGEVVIRRCHPMDIVRVLTEGESAFPHPDGGWIIAHPDRKPMCWCHEDPITNTYRQEFIEPIAC